MSMKLNWLNTEMVGREESYEQSKYDSKSHALNQFALSRFQNPVGNDKNTFY